MSVLTIRKLREKLAGETSGRISLEFKTDETGEPEIATLVLYRDDRSRLDLWVWDGFGGVERQEKHVFKLGPRSGLKQSQRCIRCGSEQYDTDKHYTYGEARALRPNAHSINADGSCNMGCC
jgi:hypothetical protein